MVCNASSMKESGGCPKLCANRDDNVVFGMGVDLATFLAIYGAVFDGDLVSWSIGGPPPGGLLGDIGLLGKPQGISKSHNKYESDASPTRGDLYER